MSNKFYAYIRVSTETQAEKGYGLDVQQKAISEYCAQNNIHIVDTFIDSRKSGALGDCENMSKRAALMRLFHEIGKEDVVLVMNTSRLWRDDGAKVIICKTLRKLNGKIISIEQPRYSLYSKDPQEFLFNSMMEILDQYDRMMINKRLSNGKSEKAQQGYKPCGRVPFGYKWSADRKHIEIVPEEAACVKQIYELANKHFGLANTAKYLNQSATAFPKNKKWSRQGVRSILANKFYTGVLIHDGEEIAGKHPPIINIQDWQYTQSRKTVTQEEMDTLFDSVNL